MDPAVAGLDFAKAGIVLANMIESYLAGGVPPPNPEGAVHDKPQDCRSTSVTASLRLRSSVDAGTGPLQPGEHRAPVQSGRQGTVSRLEPGADPDPRPGSRPIRRANDRSRGLQGPGQRRGSRPSRCDLLPGSLALVPTQPVLASPARILRLLRHGRYRRSWMFQSIRLQRFPFSRHEGYFRS